MLLSQAYSEFWQYASQGNHVDKYSKAAAAKAFDHLVTQGLVAYVDPRCVPRARWEQPAREGASLYLL